MIDVDKLVDEYPHESKWGFSSEEYMRLVREVARENDFNYDRFYGALRGNTCMIDNGKLRIYPCDIKTALKCGLENRDTKWWEMD